MRQPATSQTRISVYADMDRLGGGCRAGSIRRAVWPGAAETVCRSCGRSFNWVAEEHLPGALRDSGAAVQWGAGVPGGQGGIRERAAEAAGGQPSAANCPGRAGSFSCCSRGRSDQAHQKKRRLVNLRNRLAGLEADIDGGRVRLCFGSKRLWRKQYDLEANGYASHEEWLTDWQHARSGEFFVLGSRDETGGCQLCVASVAEDGTLVLRLRMPDCLAEQHGKCLVIEGVRFAYGHEHVLAALQSNAEYVQYRREHGEKAARTTSLGQAVSYRFKRDGKGWRVFATTELPDVEITTDRGLGAIGIDLNADHLAVAETDASGNFINAWRTPLVTYGKNTHQAEALIGNAVTTVVQYAKEAGKPIVIEKLDFRGKKAALEGEYPRYSRMLSSFSYGKIKAYFLSRGYREGVEVNQVNPAYSSVIGRVKFMERYGLSVHQAAALVLARRLLRCSERIPRRRVCPAGNGVQVAFTVPAGSG